ncbi:hypothetical protein NESM_000798700 [Novymonas esmeraldas]|uniref:Uncharacterized protein n=1 Tax=Novymonas esmeraldas TaxID=1808958 RepID=A0AAW0EXY3_9TRYP
MSSKYDVVKVRVHLTEAHYYVLSRFLLSKMLMFCRVPEDAAVRISLDLKKHFVNSECTSITQAELESAVQSAVLSSGFSQEHARLFPVVTQFHTERIPLVLFIAGPERCGKTALAHLLGSRLNCSTVINTEVLRDISAAVDDWLPPMTGSPPPEVEAEVAAAVTAEVDKAVREGRVIIVEGEDLSFAGFHHYLSSSFQSSTGAIVLGLVLQASNKDAQPDASEAYVKRLRNLRPLLTTERVSVLAAAPADDDEDRDDVVTPTVYVARCAAVSDNVSLSTFIHDVVVQRIVAELCRRHPGME